MNSRPPCSLALLLAIAAAPAFAQTPPAVPVDAETRHAVVTELAAQLEAHYVFPDLAARIAASLRAKDAAGGYAKAGDADTFSQALADDLRSIGKDLHFDVAYDPDLGPEPTDAHAAPGREDAERMYREVASHGYGIDTLQRLPGNVGYLEVRAFAPAQFAAEAMTAAIRLLSGTDALILDLRRNGGGEPDGVANLLSHFFAEGDSRHLNDIYSRTDDTTHQYWTDPAVPVRYTKPVYVLTSKRTFSGGEEAAYDLQTQKRATLVGEVTGGGANPGDGYSLSHGFAAFIPNGRAINPITHSNWEHVGVKPDLAVAAADARNVAYAAALRALAGASADEEEKAALQELAAQVEKGQQETPNYAPPR